MKSIATLILFVSLGFGAAAQTFITNGGFENWGNTVPAGDTISSEPTGWYSNKSGSAIAKLGPYTCFKESTPAHVRSGSYSVKVMTGNYLGTAVNGVVTTGVVNAPSLTKTDGYIGTKNLSDSTADDRRMNFTGRPDSLVGWYQYTQSTSPSGTSEQCKIRAILHTGDYYDPESPSSYHFDPTPNKIADVTFLGPTSNVATWTRFSVPFTYVSSSSPAYIMVNVTPSANQNTSAIGSTLWLDDLQVAYKPVSVNNIALNEQSVNVYAYGKTVCVNFTDGNDEQSVLTIFDISGKKVFSHTVLNNQFNSFKLSDLNTGIYIYQLSNSDYRKTGKLFIQ